MDSSALKPTTSSSASTIVVAAKAALEHDSGIENCNSSENSNCLGHDHDREEEDTTITANKCFDDNSVSINDEVEELDDRNLVDDDLTADYEIVETIDEETARTGATKHTDSIDNSAKRPEIVKLLPSKAEKQRQNEEIIILESSSVSSETGSWESVFPQKAQVPDPSLSSSKCTEDYGAKPIRTACFIDASSLLDDTETCFDSQHQPTDDNSACDIERRTQGVDEGNPSNIVTETKKIDYEIKDQFSSGEFSPLQLSNVLNSGSSSSSQSVCVDGGLSSRQSSVDDQRKETERKQGSLVFKNSIPQYSGVLIDNPVQEVRPPPENTTPAYKTFPLRTSASEFNCLIDIYAENKRNSGNHPQFNYFRSQSENHAEVQQIAMTDTPHNSLLNIEPNQPGRGLLVKRCESSDSVDTGPNTPKRHLKYMESAPVLSGGLSAADFTPKQCGSPPVRRKLETCPILSGGFVQDEEEVKPKKERPPQSSSVKSWVIDLNDIASPEAVSTTEVKPARALSNSAPAKKYSGFYVNLSDELTVAKEENEAVEKSAPKVRANSRKKSTGFYIDLSADEGSITTPPQSREASQTPPPQSSVENRKEEDKKNIFSMFIDFGEKKAVPKKDSVIYTSKLSNSINRRRELERRSESPRSGVVLLEDGVNKSASLTSIGGGESAERKVLPVETDHVQLRPKLKSHVEMVERETLKRHSWNMSSGSSLDKAAEDVAERPTSFTAADKGVMSIIEKIPLLSKTSSMSIDSSISPLEDFTCSKSEISTYSNNSNSVTSNYSNNSSTKELNRLKVVEEKEDRKRRRDVKINETFDKSSQSSITDGMLSKDLSPTSTTTNTDDITYQNETAPGIASAVVPDVVAEVEGGGGDKGKAAVMEMKNSLEPIIEGNEKLSSPAKKPVVSKVDENSKTAVKTAIGGDVTHTMESLQATIEKQRKLLETVNETAESTSFVRLSDMDKPFQSFEIFSTTSHSSSQSHNPEQRRPRSSYDSNYYDRNRRNNMYYSTDNNIINLASSVENSRSLSRIFPHLSKGRRYVKNHLSFDI